MKRVLLILCLGLILSLVLAGCTNQFVEIGDDMKEIGAQRMENLPTQENPFTLSNELPVFDGESGEKITAGFYNIYNTGEASVTIERCMNSEGDTTNQFSLVSESQMVEAGETAYFDMVLKGNPEPGQHVCSVVVQIGDKKLARDIIVEV